MPKPRRTLPADAMRVAYFLPPDVVQAVKVAATARKQNQSDVVTDAIRLYLDRNRRTLHKLAAV